MKNRFLAASIMALAVGISGAQDFIMPLAQTSVKIAPDRDTRSATAWVSGMDATQGLVVVKDRMFFMAETNIFATTTPPFADTRFRRLGGNLPRESLVVCNIGTNTVWLNIGAPATVGRGIRLPTGWALSLDNIQSAVYALGDAGVGGLSGVDVPRGR